MPKLSPSSAPRSSEVDSSASSRSGERAKYLHRDSVHDHSLPTVAERPIASALESEPPNSCHKIATLLLRKTRDELELTQEQAASLVDVHPVSFGRRERGDVALGPLTDWAKMLREVVRSKGPEAAGIFLAEFLEALVARDANEGAAGAKKGNTK